MATPSSTPAGFSTSSLYVGDLNADVSENMLFETFNAVGPVASIRVCRDTITRRSLGYAYVNFTNAADAERAMDQLNYTNVKGRPCRIMASQRDPGLRKSGSGNVFVHNLEKSIDNQQLYETFNMFGRILSSKVQMKDGVPLGYGFVHFEKDEDAAKAIAQVNGMEIQGQTVRVELFKPLAERDGSKKAKFTNVYVKNLPDNMTTEQLTELFARHGEIANVYIAADETGKSKAFGFVNFANPDDALAATEALHDLELDGKKLFVGRAQKKTERERELRERFEKLKEERRKKYVPGTNLYVKNLADDVDDEVLREEFSKIGPITSAKVMHDRESGRLRGFGFVCFQLPEDATRAVTELNGKLTRGKPLYVALAQRRDARRVQLEAQFANAQYAQVAQGGMGAMGGMGPMGPMGFPMGAPPMFYAQQRNGPMGAMPPQMMAPYAAQRGGAQGMPGQGGPQQGVRAPFPQGYMNPQQMMPQGYMNPQQQVPQMRGQQQAQGMPGAQGVRAPRPAGVQALPGQGIKPRVATTPMVGATPADALSPEVLAAASPEMQKQIIGERLYAQIMATQPAAAAKITGMLLEMDNTELLNLLESPAALNEKVAEALRVLSEHQPM